LKNKSESARPFCTFDFQVQQEIQSRAMNYAAIGLILIAVVSMILSAFWVRARAIVCFEPLKTEEKGLGKKLPFNVPLFSKSFLKSPPCSFFDKRDKRELF